MYGLTGEMVDADGWQKVIQEEGKEWVRTRSRERRGNLCV